MAPHLERSNGTPQVNGSATYLLARIPGLDLDDDGSDGSAAASGTGALDVYNLGFDASWEIDLFGGLRRSVEATPCRIGGDLRRLQVSFAAQRCSVASLADALRAAQPGPTIAEVAIQKALGLGWTAEAATR